MNPKKGNKNIDFELFLNYRLRTKNLHKLQNIQCEMFIKADGNVYWKIFFLCFVIYIALRAHTVAHSHKSTHQTQQQQQQNADVLQMKQVAKVMIRLDQSNPIVMNSKYGMQNTHWTVNNTMWINSVIWFCCLTIVRPDGNVFVPSITTNVIAGIKLQCKLCQLSDTIIVWQNIANWITC